MTGETSFSITYGVEAVLPVEVKTLTHRVITSNESVNAEAMNGELDLLEEKRLNS